MSAIYSGRYLFNGGAQMDNTPSISTIHNIEEPVNSPSGSRSSGKLQFTLHIDIDGVNPLKVVSGVVAQAGIAKHFIAQVTSNERTSTGRELTSERFSFDWPATGESIDLLNISLFGAGTSNPDAEVTFITTRNVEYGPFTASRASAFFRSVEVEIDRESGAVAVESYDTHAHPDRPASIEREKLTLESVFAKAGIEITRSRRSNVVNASEAGIDKRWSTQELHDSMEKNWSAFANKSQWKLWILLARLSNKADLGGVMFDMYIDEPGGVDRQGVAIFTKQEDFHREEGAYAQANPPAAEAAERELFFNLIHETGHAFNLLHSFEKTDRSEGPPWSAPNWMHVVSNDDEALSWMNYPDRASPGKGFNASWFYRNFSFRFDNHENLFLRHAPSRFVMPGNEAWAYNHGRAAHEDIDPGLLLAIRNRKAIVELGEVVCLELKFKNISNTEIFVHDKLSLEEQYVQIAITSPANARMPFFPIVRERSAFIPRLLKPGEAIYQPVKLNIGSLGSPFKEPGAYRIEACYTNFDGSKAAAVMQLYVRPPANFDDYMAINELFNARTGRVLYLGGSRIMEDAVDKLGWVSAKLGDKHPLQYHINSALGSVFDREYKLIDPETKEVILLQEDPYCVEKRLKPIVENVESAADTLGHIGYERLVGTYVDCAQKVKKKTDARYALKSMLALFKQRKVIDAAIKKTEAKLKKLQ